MGLQGTTVSDTASYILGQMKLHMAPIPQTTSGHSLTTPHMNNLLPTDPRYRLPPPFPDTL